MSMLWISDVLMHTQVLSFARIAFCANKYLLEWFWWEFCEDYEFNAHVSQVWNL
jgi:hypothetical protein